MTSLGSPNENQCFCLVREARHRHSDACAISEGSVELSFTELDNWVQSIVERTIEFFSRKHGGCFARVGILAESSSDTIATIFALQRLGICPVLLNTRLTPSDWILQLDMANVEAVIIDRSAIGLDFGSDRKIVHLENLTQPKQRIGENPQDIDPLKADGEACIIFTSGSSGKPKGVRLSHDALRLAAEGSNSFTELTSKDSWLLSLPLYHVGGLGIVYRCLSAGARIVVPKRESALLLVQTLREKPVTHLSLVPTQLEQLLELLPPDEPLFRKVKCILLAGAPSSESLLNRIRNTNLPVQSCYGMSETGSHFTCVKKSEALSRLRTVGVPLPGIEVQQDADGVLEVRGRRLMLGYLDDHEVKDYRKEWFSTGDIVSFEKDGSLGIIGRADDMFISGGENIHPAEIENVALMHSGVQSAAVVPILDPTWGQRPVLLVQAKSENTISIPELEQHLSSSLAKYKVPNRILVVDKIPVTSNGKIARDLCKALIPAIS